MSKSPFERILRPFAEVRANEISTTLLMFSYSFLAMTAYNIIQPIQRSLFIERLGANKIPYVQLAAGVFIGLIMTGYTWLMSRLPRRWSLPITQGGIVVLLVVFWFLFRTENNSVYVGFYILGLILGILLISQFWTLANVVYDPRQAKRLFGFIGGGASLGGMLGAFITWFSSHIGTVNLLLVSASVMLVCMIIVTIIIRRERVGEKAGITAEREEKGVGARRAFELLRESKHLRLIALVISFGAIGAAIVDQQLNMATEAFKGQAGRDAMTAFLGQVRVWTSGIGFLIQIAVTSRIHRSLGIGFALLLLPVGLGTTATIILLNAVLWAPSLARVLDQSLRYTVDKTTREILYMPLPDEIKYEAKPFVDVTLDRFAKGLIMVVLLVLISPWGLGFGWQKLSYVSAGLTVIWIFAALRAKQGYQAAFRRSIETREMKPAEVRLAVADLSTVETLIEELASPDERRVLYAIEMLESLDKRNLITPLLLYHESPDVRVRALGNIGGLLTGNPERWLPAVQRMLRDPSPTVRAASVGALAGLRGQAASDLVRPMLQEKDPRIALTAAMVLTHSGIQEDASLGEQVLTEMVYDTRDSAADIRRDFAIAIRHVSDPRCRRLLIPLLHDADPQVAEEALRSVRMLGTADFIFVPTLISLLRHRRFKSSAREILVGIGEQVLPILGHFLRDPEEEIWVRRHIPATIARIPCQKSMDILIGALDEPDGFLRFKIVAAAEKLHRERPDLTFEREPVEALVLNHAAQYCRYYLLHRRLLAVQPSAKDSLLDRALSEKLSRGLDRIYRLLGLLYPWRDIQSARWSIEHGESRARAAALEFLDNLLQGSLRSRLMRILEDTLEEGELVRLSGLPEAPKGLESILLQLVHDTDPVISATAAHFAGQVYLKNLGEPLEEILATRDARDWCVFEAVSWVLAAFRMPEGKRRTLWQESLPAVEVADRLRGLRLFASVSVAELFQLAGAGRQLRHEPGRWLYQEGVVPEHLQFLLDGSVTTRSSTGPAGEVLQPPAALGLREVLEGKPAPEAIQTRDASVCLVLSSDECRTLLADNTDMVQGMFRMLCDGETGNIRRTVLKGDFNGNARISPTGGFKDIDKVLILQSIPVFSNVSAEEMRSLASIAAETPLAAGSILFGESDSPALFAVVSGEVTLDGESGTSQLKADAGDVIGVYETLAGVPLGLRGIVVSDGVALRLDREEMFDLLSQRPDLLQQLFAALFNCQAVAVSTTTA